MMYHFLLQALGWPESSFGFWTQMNFLANPIHVTDHSKMIYEEKAATHKKLKKSKSEKSKKQNYI